MAEKKPRDITPHELFRRVDARSLGIIDTDRPSLLRAIKLMRSFMSRMAMSI